MKEKSSNDFRIAAARVAYTVRQALEEGAVNPFWADILRTELQALEQYLLIPPSLTYEALPNA